MDIPNIETFIEAISNQHWPLVAAFGLTILVWILRNIAKDKIPKEYIPYLALVIALISSTSGRIIQYAQDESIWWYGLIHGVIEGLVVGFSSMGIWSSGGKKLPIRED